MYSHVLHYFGQDRLQTNKILSKHTSTVSQTSVNHWWLKSGTSEFQNNSQDNFTPESDVKKQNITEMRVDFSKIWLAM